MTRRIMCAVIAVGMTIGLLSPDAAAAAGRSDSVVASFEGGWIRLADGWGEANACTIDDSGARCYRSEAEMDKAESGNAGRPASVLADCATPGVRLYRSSSYAGQVLQILTRFTYVSLVPAGFDNDTSSYKIGACTSDFYDTSTGGTSYPGSTAAGVSSPSMSSGWDNRISSVYIF